MASFTFVGQAFVRAGRERVEVSGDLRGMKLKVAGQPQLILNGKAAKARVAGGLLTLGE